VTGTPAVFVNGRPLDLPMSRENLAQAIDDELEFVAGHGQFKPDAP
jgi:protein-disulfide isomerase